MIRLRGSTVARRATAARSGFSETGWSRLRCRMRVVVLTPLALLVGGVANVFACPVCFGAEETGIIDGAKLGVLVMLGITLLVQGAFVAFFLYLRRHARRNADIELDAEWLELQRGPRTS